MTRFIRRNLQELFGLVYCSILALFCLFTGDPFFLGLKMLGYAVGVSCAGYWFWAIGDNARIDGLEAIVRELERRFEEIYKREHPANRVEEELLPIELDPVLNAERN